MTFLVGVTRDLLGPDGRPLADIGLSTLTADPDIEWQFLPPHGPELQSADVAGFDAVLVWDTRVSAATVADPGRLVHVARLGVGLDGVDVEACTHAGVLVTITPDGVRRPVASAAVAMILALSHRVPMLDRVVRSGRWYEQVHGVGRGLTGRALGIVGLGNIGREVARLIEPWDMKLLATDPYPPPTPPPGVTLTTLDDLLAASDFVVLTCPLTVETHHLIDANRLSLMRVSAYLVNVARGPIVDTEALAEALAAGRLAGAALDVLEHEPPTPTHPLLGFENVILSPHAIAATDEFNLAVGTSALAAVRAVADGRRPQYLVNPDAAGHDRFTWRSPRCPPPNSLGARA